MVLACELAQEKKNVTKLLQNRLRLEAISVLRDEEWSFRPGLELIAPVVVYDHQLGG